MKFGKQILNQSYTEWVDEYMNYKQLKKIIKGNLPIPEGMLTLASNKEGYVFKKIPKDQKIETDASLQIRKTTFFLKLDRELEKVNVFYSSKIDTIETRLISLKSKFAHSKVESFQKSQLNLLKEAFRDLLSELRLLEDYIELNQTGFRKILKKWDKRTLSQIKQKYLAREIETQPWYKSIAIKNIEYITTDYIHKIEIILNHDVLSKPQDDVMAETYFNFLLNQSQSTLNINKEDIDNIKNSLTLLVLNNIEQITNLVMLELYLQNELIDKNMLDINERNLLHLTIISSKFDKAKLLIRYNININAIDSFNKSPLHYCCLNGNTESLTLLLQNNADLTLVDNSVNDSVSIAIRNGHLNCLKLIIPSYIEPEHKYIELACMYGKPEILKYLISNIKTFDINQINSNGVSLLHISTKIGRVDLIKILVSSGAKINLQDSTNGWSPLYYAANYGHVDCLELLILLGANINVFDESGASPAYYALYEGHKKCLDILIDVGCSVQLQTPCLPSLSLPPSVFH